MWLRETCKAAVVAGLAVVAAHCNDGCGGTWISPAEAYGIESQNCANSANASERACIEESKDRAGALQCVVDADEQYRKCMSMVEKKYARYSGEGRYPGATPGSNKDH